MPRLALRIHHSGGGSRTIRKNVYIYVSGTSFVRQTEELAGCSGEKPDKDPNTRRCFAST